MANSTVPIIHQSTSEAGTEHHVTVGTVALPEGVMVAQLTADATLVNPAYGTTGAVIGVMQHSAAIAATGVIETEREYIFDNSSGSACSATTKIGAAVFAEDNHTIAAASGGNKVSAGTFRGMDGTKVRVRISPLQPAPAADATNIAELQVDATGTVSVPVPFLAARLVAGTVLPAFVDDAGGSSPGIIVVNSKAFGVRWNNQAAQTAIWTNFVMPADIDTSKNASLEFLVSKIGATIGDAVKITAALYNQVATALHDADTNFGGDSTALAGDATSKTITKLTLALTAADLAAAGSGVSLSVKPKDGTLGTDDAILHAINLVYTRKMLTA